MKYFEMLREKEAFIRAVVDRTMREDAPLSELKNKTIHLARLSIRSDAVDGGSIPDDEVQLDFTITNSDVDSFGSIMTEKTMQNYTEDAARGVSFVRDHTEGVASQLGRTIAATYDSENKRVVATVSMLRDSEDTPENMRINEYIRRIERRFYDSCSVAFRDATETCNLCNKEIFDFYRDDPCPHIPKKMYDGEMCTYNVDDARLRHIGLVTSPSNPNAKLLDTREWSEDILKVKKEGGSADTGDSSGKSLLERDGEKYRQSLIDTAVKEGIRAEDDFDETVWRERLKTRDAEEIVAQTATWTKLGDARWGQGGRATSPEGGGTSGGSQDNVLILPDYLFNL